MPPSTAADKKRGPGVTIPDLEPTKWLLGALTALLVGIAKTGVPGVGTLAVPLMVLTVGDARHASGWLLPLLCVADLLAVGIYRRQAYARRLFILFPWVLAGMACGTAALYAPEAIMRPTVALIVLAMILVRWWNGANGPSSEATSPPPARPRVQAAVYGSAAGFSTTLANAAGPVMSLYLLAQRLPKEEFVGTGAWFFLIVNLCKVPIYAGHRLIDATSLAFDAMLIPAVLAGAWLGRAVLRRLRQDTFERLVLALTVLACALLFIPKGR